MSDDEAITAAASTSRRVRSSGPCTERDRNLRIGDETASSDESRTARPGTVPAVAHRSDRRSARVRGSSGTVFSTDGRPQVRIGSGGRGAATSTATGAAFVRGWSPAGSLSLPPKRPARASQGASRRDPRDRRSPSRRWHHSDRNARIRPLGNPIRRIRTIGSGCGPAIRSPISQRTCRDSPHDLDPASRRGRDRLQQGLGRGAKGRGSRRDQIPDLSAHDRPPRVCGPSADARPFRAQQGATGGVRPRGGQGDRSHGRRAAQIGFRRGAPLFRHVRSRRRASSSAMPSRSPGKTMWPSPFISMIRCAGDNARTCCPIPTTSRPRTGSKSRAPAGAPIGVPSPPGSRPRCVSTAPPSWPR